MEHMNNISVSEFGNIRSGVLSNFLTAMLCVNAIGITLAVGMLDEGFSYPQNLGIAISVLSCAGAVFLFFMLNRYIQTINYKFNRIEPKRLESISTLAKRFFTPFVLSICVDIMLALLGTGTLLMALWEEA